MKQKCCVSDRFNNINHSLRGCAMCTPIKCQSRCTPHTIPVTLWPHTRPFTGRDCLCWYLWARAREEKGNLHADLKGERSWYCHQHLWGIPKKDLQLCCPLCPVISPVDYVQIILPCILPYCTVPHLVEVPFLFDKFMLECLRHHKLFWCFLLITRYFLAKSRSGLYRK